jgi:hypothetical protein
MKKVSNVEHNNKRQSSSNVRQGSLASESKEVFTMEEQISEVNEIFVEDISKGTEMRSIGVPTQYGWYPPDIKSGGTSIGLGSLGTQTNDGGAQLQSHIDVFYTTLNEKQRKGLEIAKQQLGQSFSLEKCLLYITWKKEQEKYSS